MLSEIIFKNNKSGHKMWKNKNFQLPYNFWEIKKLQKNLYLLEKIKLN